MVVRTTADAGRLAAPVYQAVRALDAQLLPTVTTMRQGLSRATELPRFYALLSAATSGVALVLAITGVFGLAAFIIESRAPEIGLRIAVGASRTDVVRLTVRDSLQPVLSGATVGIVLAVIFGRLTESLLYGVSAANPIALAGAAIVLVGTAGLAAIIPTRRIASIDPVAALSRR
jgi:putative ABC transport system permease protein